MILLRIWWVKSEDVSVTLTLFQTFDANLHHAMIMFLQCPVFEPMCDIGSGNYCNNGGYDYVCYPTGGLPACCSQSQGFGLTSCPRIKPDCETNRSVPGPSYCYFKTTVATKVESLSAAMQTIILWWVINLLVFVFVLSQLFDLRFSDQIFSHDAYDYFTVPPFSANV